MPVALVGMRPERALTDLNTFWDWGIVYEFCPSKQLNVIGDSDDFLMMELRSKNRSINRSRFGRSSPKQISKRLMGHITQYQLDNAQFELRLHSREASSRIGRCATPATRSGDQEVAPSAIDVRIIARHRNGYTICGIIVGGSSGNAISSRIERITSEIEVSERQLVQGARADR